MRHAFFFLPRIYGVSGIAFREDYSIALGTIGARPQCGHIRGSWGSPHPCLLRKKNWLGATGAGEILVPLCEVGAKSEYVLLFT